jgi:hypothetical protein
MLENQIKLSAGKDKAGGETLGANVRITLRCI